MAHTGLWITTPGYLAIKRNESQKLQPGIEPSRFSEFKETPRKAIYLMLMFIQCFCKEKSEYLLQKMGEQMGMTAKGRWW